MGPDCSPAGSYEAAVESGVHKEIQMRRTKRILKIRKQDSYTRAIGGSFEDEHSQREERRKERTAHIKKQVREASSLWMGLQPGYPAMSELLFGGTRFKRTISSRELN